jgi:hypothetical protein
VHNIGAAELEPLSYDMASSRVWLNIQTPLEIALTFKIAPSTRYLNMTIDAQLLSIVSLRLSESATTPFYGSSEL